MGGKEGETEEWDLVEEFFNRIRDLHEDEEEEEGCRSSLYSRYLTKLKLTTK